MATGVGAVYLIGGAMFEGIAAGGGLAAFEVVTHVGMATFPGWGIAGIGYGMYHFGRRGRHRARHRW